MMIVEHATTNETEVVDFNEYDWAWLAGFLEGRGMMGVSRNKWRLVIRFGKLPIMEFIADMMEVAVSGPYQDQFPQRKQPGTPYYLIQIYDRETLLRVYDRLYPYLSDSRL